MQIELIIEYLGITIGFGFLVAMCYVCLSTLFEAKDSKKIIILYGIAVMLGYFVFSIINNMNFLLFRIIYLTTVIFLSGILLFKGKTTKKMGVSAILLLGCVFLDGLSFLSYVVISIDWVKTTEPLKQYLFYSCTETLLIIGFYKAILDKISSKKIVKKVYLYQNLFMLGIIILEIVIVNVLMIYSSDNNQMQMILIGISMLLVIAFDCGLIVFLKKIEKNFQLKQNLELQEQQMEIQEKYYKKVQMQYEETTDLMNNMKKYILTLKEYYEEGDCEKAKHYVKTTLEEITNTGLHYGCKDKTLAIILEDKRQSCEAKGIILKVKDRSQGLGQIIPFDITTIFTNLLDNAIEAIEEMDNPEITVELFSQEMMLIILIENTIKQKPIKKSGHYLSSKKENGHGLGLKNVETAVKKYGGSMDIQISNDVFVVRIIVELTDDV